MAILPWFFENFQAFVPEADLAGQGLWTKVVDTSAGGLRFKIDNTPIIIGKSIRAEYFGQGFVTYRLPLPSPELDWQVILLFKHINDGSSAAFVGIKPILTTAVKAAELRLFAGNNNDRLLSTTGRIDFATTGVGAGAFGSQSLFDIPFNANLAIFIRRSGDGVVRVFANGVQIFDKPEVSGSVDRLEITIQRAGTAVNPSNNSKFATTFVIGNIIIPPIPPSPPASLTAVGSPNQIDLSWGAPGDPGTDPIIGYKIFRSTVSETETFLTTVGDVLAFTDTAVVNGQEYFYKVLAFSAAGDGALSNEDSAIPVAPPSPPLNLRAVAASTQNVLTWDPPTTPGGIIIAYKVYRATVSGILATKTLITTLGNIFTFTDIGLTNGTTYYYQVTASTNPEGPESNEANGTPSSNAIPAKPENVFANQRENYAILSWGRVTEREDGHTLASDTYATGFEPPVFIIADLKNQDGWLQTFQSAVGFDIIVQSSVVITDLQSAQFNLVAGGGSMTYQKTISVITDIAYEVSWKWFMDTIVTDPHTYSFNFEMRDGVTGKILVELFNDDEVLLSVGGTPVTAVADSGGTHEYKIRITPNAIDPIAGVGTVDLFVDNVKILSRTAVAIARADRIELVGNAQAAYTSGSGFIDSIAVRLVGLADVTQYNVYRSLNMNESDRKQIATITTKDIENFVDTAFVDLNSKDVKIYRVSSVILDAGNQLESSLSDRAVAIKLPSQIDRKEEVLDRRIMKWGTGTWGQLWGG